MSLLKMYDFTVELTDREGMMLASKFAFDVNNVNEEMTKWFFKIALPFNDPSKPIMAGKAFEKHCQSLETFILSPEAGDAQWTKSNGRIADFSLTGKNGIARAYKKLLNAIKLGGDLIASESKYDYGNELSSVSACERFAAKRNKQITIDGEAKQAIEELHQLIEEEHGLERGTPEHEAKFKEESLKLAATNEIAKEGEAKKNDGDVYDELGRQFAAQLRAFREAGEGEKVVYSMGESLIARVGVSVSKILERIKAA